MASNMSPSSVASCPSRAGVPAPAGIYIVPNGIGFTVRPDGFTQPMNAFTFFQKTVDGNKGIVDGMTQEIARGVGNRNNLPLRRDGRFIDSFKGTVKAFEDPVKLHSHLICECPASYVIRRGRRRPGKCKVIGGSPVAQTCPTRGGRNAWAVLMTKESAG